jgi:hypothetical protein
MVTHLIEEKVWVENLRIMVTEVTLVLELELELNI